MDKLKENAFALGLAGAGLVLVAAGYFLVWKPWSELGARREALAAEHGKLSKYTKEKSPEPLPTEESAAREIEAKKKLAGEYQRALRIWSDRSSRFQLFFDDQEQEPSYGDFFSKYSDKLTGTSGLLTEYRTKFELEPDKKDGAIAPALKGTPGASSAEFTVREAQKAYWAIEAIVQAANQHEIGGLLEIEYDNKKAKNEKVDPTTPFIVSSFTMVIKVRLPYSKIRPFLEALYTSDRVPFVDAEIEYKKIPEFMTNFAAARIQVAEGALGYTGAYAELVAEPDVEATIRLKVLDWGGPRAREGAASGAAIDQL